MRVDSLFIKKKKDRTIEKIEEGYLIKDYGLAGDINGVGGDRQVSIATKKVRRYMEKGDLEGICSNRFYENITIEGLNIEKLYIGQWIIIGDTVQEITSIGKRCFPECNLLISHNPCPLFKEVLFAKVIKEGPIKVGDKVDLINNTNLQDEIR
ncbi:MOSC domain-containing protein [Clostridium sp. Cult2]|uniref:MOSC domain-containing protein n=1 Tax=Clostridium sp. Cult2 TaxID=2079003 RepID=UPI001F372979|nr:MOSC domain-containing protein [Clostridium sp. Cult2]MCF6465151.1 MOSC domain-containing protein [Clostridium sp. Cult2]